uniref:Feline leukemia virus subgroup C receptor-related protein 2-like n=1 Tax=Phallusia mammillata TaxID=59560 RepID=A0A6F9DCF1_9ASCI|nr:feline leukemia virus subgroup C receptor-related protein 2-like [Phallusia mammillata]
MINILPTSKGIFTVIVNAGFMRTKLMSVCAIPKLHVKFKVGIAFAIKVSISMLAMDVIQEQFKLYKRRWAFLLGLFLLQFCAGISFASYGQINWFYVEFFKSTPATVDWITNARNISAIVITFPLAFLIFKDKIGLKGLVLIIAGSSTIGLLFVTLSLIDRSLIALIVIGQIFCGLSETVAVGAPSTFAVLWFPENQVGTAIALNVVGLYVGNEVGYTLPSYLVTPSNDTVEQEGMLSLEDLTEGQRQLRYMYGAFLAISTIVTCLFVIFLTDKPPTPPTHAQDLKNKELKPEKSAKEFFNVTKQLFSMPSYALICIAIGFIFQLVLIENMMMSEIISDLHIAKNVEPSTLSGYIMCTFGVGAIVGLTSGGKVVDRFKRYKLMALCGGTADFFSVLGIAISAICKNTPGLYACNALFGFLTGFTIVVLFEMATQLTYPIDETLVNNWMTGIQTLIALLMGILARVMFQHWKSIGVLAFQCACVLMALLMLTLVSSRNRRLEVDDERVTDEKPQDAETPLLSSQQ